MFYKGQLVRIDPSKLHKAYPEESESALQDWYQNFQNRYHPTLIVDYVNEFDGCIMVHVFLKYLNGGKTSACYRIGILVPVQEEDLNFVDIELFI